MADSPAVLYESPVTALSAGDTLILAVGGPYSGRFYAGVEFYSESTGTVEVNPDTGTLVFDTRTQEIPSVWQSPAIASVDLSVANEIIDWSGYSQFVRVSGLSGVSGGGATHFRLRVTGAS